jgi:hypothetical protein
MNEILQARPIGGRNLCEFLTSEFEATDREHARQLNLLAQLETRFEQDKLKLSDSDFLLLEAQCRQQRFIVDNAKAARDAARASLDTELGRLAKDKLKENDAEEMRAIEKELKANGEELVNNNLRERQLRERDVQLHYRQTWLMQRRADLEKRSGAMPAGRQPEWYDDRFKTQSQKLQEILS